MCYNGEWYSICSDNWSEKDAEANVVCSTLGYSVELGQKCYIEYMLQKKNKSRFIAVSIVASFGKDLSPILPREIKCSGNELTLSNCSITEYDPQECQQVAGVICEGLLYTQ